jgi:hypothetical protein
VSDVVTAAQGAAIANTTNATATFTLGVADSISNLVTTGAASTNLVAIKTDHGAVPIAISDASAAAADLTAIDGATTGVVTGASLTSISGTAAQVAAVMAVTTALVVGTESTNVTNAGVTLTAGSVTMADLKAVDDGTSGFVDASAVTAITAASIADAELILVTNSAASGDGKVSHGTNVAVTLTDTTASDAADLVLIADATLGVVNASTIATISTSTVAQAKQLLSTDSVTFTHNPAVAFTTISDSGSAADVDLILGATTSNVTVSVTGGTADALNTALTNATATDALTLTLTAASQAAASITALDAKTSVDVVVSAATGITGTGAEITALLTAITASTVGALSGSQTFTATAATAAQATSIFAATTSGVTNVELVNSYTSGGTVSVIAGDVIDIDASNSTTALATETGATAATGVSLVTDVDATGEWFYVPGGLFTWWDDSEATPAVNSITITGAATLTVAGDTITIAS